MSLRSFLAKAALGASMILPACSSSAPSTAPSSDHADAGAGASSPRCPGSYAAEPVEVPNARGVLDGTLLVPAGCGPFSVALVVPGSGPTDRDGNNAMGLRTDAYRLLAEGLAAAGVASLRYDKAGIGASASAAPRTESEMRFEMGAEDAALLVQALRADPRFSRVVVVGHSEGSLVGMLAAGRAPVDAFASIAGAGRPAEDVLREQLAENIEDPSLLATADRILDALAQGQTVADVPSSLASLFRPSVQPYLISWMKYDPAKEIAKVAAPALVVQGTTDIQVSTRDAELLAAARPDAKLDFIDGMSHVLKAATTDPASQNAAYTDPSLPVVPALLSDLAAFANDVSTPAR